MLQTLYTTISGIVDGLSGVHSNFKEYDAELSGLLSTVGQVHDLIVNGAATMDVINYNTNTRITTLAGSTSYILEDAHIYRCELIDDTTFFMPEILNEDVFHEIVLSVKFPTVYYTSFKLQDSTALTINGQNDWDPGDVVQYMIRYESLLTQKWQITPVKI